VLALLVLQTVALKELHILLDGHHLAKVAHCDDVKNGEAHLHSEEYAPVDCSVCFFNFAPATLEFADLSLVFHTISIECRTFHYEITPVTTFNWHFQLRGPPCLAA